jgi:hypothetical protein
MARLAHETATYKSPLHQRIMAKLSVQASWVNEDNGNVVFVNGLTENLGESSVLVNLDVLPAVGSDVKLRLLDENNFIIEVEAHVIRVERDPGKPLAALSISENLKQWKQKALTAAQDWVTRNWRLNYEEDWVN